MELRITKSIPSGDLRPGQAFMHQGNLYTADQVSFDLDGSVVTLARRGLVTEGRRHTVEFTAGDEVTIVPDHDQLVALRQQVIEALNPWVEATDWDVQLGGPTSPTKVTPEPQHKIAAEDAETGTTTRVPAHLAARMKEQA